MFILLSALRSYFSCSSDGNGAIAGTLERSLKMNRIFLQFGSIALRFFVPFRILVPGADWSAYRGFSARNHLMILVVIYA